MSITDIPTWAEAIASLLAIITTTVGVVRYFNRKNNEISQLYQTITKVTRQNEQLYDTLSASHLHSVTNAFDDLKNKSEELATSLGADYYSVLVGVPAETPQVLRIIHATGSAAKSVTGKEFPCDKGISGWAFTHQES